MPTRVNAARTPADWTRPEAPREGLIHVGAMT